MTRSTRPSVRNLATVSTPRAETLIELLGPGLIHGPIAFTRDEFKDLRKLYRFEPEKPHEKPPPPEAPKRSDFDAQWKYEDAVRRHPERLRAHENWQDPLPLWQAGADRNTVRHADADGLRLIAWLARFCNPGEDPLKVLVQMAIDAGFDVDPADVDWVEDEDDPV